MDGRPRVFSNRGEGDYTKLTQIKLKPAHKRTDTHASMGAKKCGVLMVSSTAIILASSVGQMSGQ
jgi:hypothetical protein